MSDWQSDLDTFFGKKEEKQQEQDAKLEASQALVAPLLEGKILPAFEEVKTALERHGRRIEIGSSSGSYKPYASFRVFHGDTKELDYTLELRVSARGVFPVPVTRFWDKSDGKTYRAEGFLRSGAQDYDASSLTQEDYRNNLLDAYKQSDAVRGK